MPSDESDTDDAILAIQTLKGNNTAFSTLFARYHDRVKAMKTPCCFSLFLPLCLMRKRLMIDD